MTTIPYFESLGYKAYRNGDHADAHTHWQYAEYLKREKNENKGEMDTGRNRPTRSNVGRRGKSEHHSRKIPKNRKGGNPKTKGIEATQSAKTQED